MTGLGLHPQTSKLCQRYGKFCPDQPALRANLKLKAEIRHIKETEKLSHHATNHCLAELNVGRVYHKVT